MNNSEKDNTEWIIKNMCNDQLRKKYNCIEIDSKIRTVLI